MDHRAIVLCRDCGHGWAARFSEAELERHYREDYYSSPEDPRIGDWIAANQGVWGRLANDLRHHFGRAPQSLLDVGAGTGGFLQAVRAAFPETRLHAIESSPHAREHLRQCLPGVTFPVDDAGQLAQVDATYDCIVLLQVLEHVANPLALCHDILARLNPGGMLLLTVPNRHSHERLTRGARRSHCHGNPTHLQFFSRRSMERLLRQAGFAGIRRIVNFDGQGCCDLPAMAQWLLRRTALSTELRYVAYRPA